MTFEKALVRPRIPSPNMDELSISAGPTTSYTLITLDTRKKN